MTYSERIDGLIRRTMMLHDFVILQIVFPII